MGSGQTPVSPDAQIRPGRLKPAQRIVAKKEARLRKNGASRARLSAGKSDFSSLGKEALVILLPLWKLNGNGHLGLVAQNAKLDGLVFLLGQQLFTQLAGAANACAVHAGDYIADFNPRLGSGGTREHIADQHALAVRRAEEAPEIALQAFGVN